MCTINGMTFRAPPCIIQRSNTTFMYVVLDGCIYINYTHIRFYVLTVRANNKKKFIS